MREIQNHQAVLEALHAQPGSSRPDLARRTSLSRPTVSAIVDELLARGLLEERAASHAGTPARRGTGRPPRLLRVAPRCAYAIGLEFERDHVGWVICDLAGTDLGGGREAIAPDAGAHASIELVAALAEAGLAEAGIPADRVLGVGAAIAAPIERPAGTPHAEGLLPGWVGVRAAEAIEQRLGRPVVLDNDANAGALGERAFGAGTGIDDLVYLRLSAGVGAGLVTAGRLYTGGAGMAGEIGHLTVVPDGAICRCGNRGCLEATASPVAVAAQLQAAIGAPVDVDRLMALVDEGHRGARRAVADAGELVGRAVAATVNVVNPRTVILGGELAGAGDVLLDAVRRALERHASPPVAATVDVRIGALGDRAEVLGAAALVLADAPRRLAARLAEQGAPPAAA